MKTPQQILITRLTLLALTTLKPRFSTNFGRGALTLWGARPSRKRMLIFAAAMSLILGVATLANATALQYNGNYLGGRLIYDPNTDLTWYQAPYANVTWYAAMDWAAGLNIGGTTGWRFPSIAPATVIDGGIQMIVTGNLEDGEMGYLWYDELGNHLGAMTNSGPFDPATWTTPNNGFWTDSGPWYGHMSTFAVFFDLHNGNYGLDVIQGSGALAAEIAVCAGNIGPNGPVAPRLAITRSGNSVIVSWPTPSTSWTLQQCSDLAAGNWSDCGDTISDDGTNSSVTITPPTGNLFFRLKQP